MFHCDKIEDLERQWRWCCSLGVKETYILRTYNEKGIFNRKPLFFWLGRVFKQQLYLLFLDTCPILGLVNSVCLKSQELM